jgi:hypothetical protein
METLYYRGYYVNRDQECIELVTRPAMCVQLNTECAFVGLVIQNAMRIRHIVICGVPDCTVFFLIISQTARFSKKKVIELKLCFLILSINFA